MEKWTVKEHLVGDRYCTVSTKMISGAGFTMINQLPDQKLPLSAEPKPKIYPCASCSLAFSSQKFLSQHAEHNHPSQILLRTSARDRLQTKDSCPGNQNHQQQYSDPHSWRDKPEDREVKERPQPLLQSVRLWRVSRASSYSPKGQMGDTWVSERMMQEPSTGQKVNTEDTGKLCMGAGVLTIMRVKSVGKTPRIGQVSSHTRGYTLGKNPMLAGSVGETSVRSHLSSDPRGHT